MNPKSTSARQALALLNSPLAFKGYFAGFFAIYNFFYPLHHGLFLDNIEKLKKNLSKVLNTFENIMENGAFAFEQMLLFHNIFKYMIFQRCQKALL